MNALPRVVSSAVRLISVGTSRNISRLTSSSGIALILAAGVVSVATLHAQTGRAGLISQAVVESDRVVLSGNTHPLATRTADRGAVEPGMPASRMLLLLRRSPEQELSLQATIESLHDSNSPNFHKWLTPEQFGAQWGAADSDIAAATAWLQSHGFQVAGPTPGRTAIEFSGTAGQIQEAFHTEIHSYQVNGQMHHANVADPEIPAALAPLVAGISTLNDFHPRSQIRKGPRGIYNTETKRIRPELTSNGSFGDFLYVGPADAATIYNSPIKTLNPAATGATVDGTGAKIGIIGDSNISTTQNANYRKLFGLAPKSVTVVVDGPNPGENGDAVEAYLDTEVANGIAPGAKIFFYTAADTDVDYGVDLATVRAVNDNLVDILNLSFGECEGALGTSGNQLYKSIWQQAAAQGISVTVSSGDAGAAGCDNPDTQVTAYYGLQVNGLASTPYNIAVGGTDFAVLAGPDGSGADFTNYVSATNISSTTLLSAKGVIPEVPWNDSLKTFPPSQVSASTAFESPYANIIAAGGGKSGCSVGGFNNVGKLVCTSAYGKPSWQSAPGVPSDSVRDLPDVSLFAANGLDYATWGICTDQDGDENGNPVKDCTPGSDGLPSNEFYIYGVGGTSASAPAFAGVLALIRQSTGERQGQANYVLYHLARIHPAVFHDVRTGNNSVVCQLGTPNCSANSAGSDLLTGYNAGAGYDLASGLGSVDISALVANWSSAGLAASTTHLTLSKTSIQHGQTVVADATVTGASAPTGQVSLSAGANPPSFPVGVAIGNYPLKSGGTTGNLNINYLPGGSYKVIASYGGSAALSQSVSSPVSITVSPESSTTRLTVKAYDPSSGALFSGSSIPYGYIVNFFAQPYGNRSNVSGGGTVQPDGVATGSVTFTEGPVSLGNEPVGLDGYAAAVGRWIAPGAYTAKAAYHGDNSFIASTGTHKLTITKASTHIALAASSVTYTGKPVVFTVAVSTDSAGAAPAGTITLKAGTTILAQTSLAGTAATDDELAAGTATISTSNVPLGTAEIEAVYNGDVNYSGATSNTIKFRGKPTFVVANVSFGLPGEHTTGANYIPIKSMDGYAGTIKLTCRLMTKTSTPTPPECAMYPDSVDLAAGKVVKPQILIFGKGTKLPSGVTQSSNAGNGLGLGLSAGGAVLACCLFFGIPARRRGWRLMLSVCLMVIAVAGLSSCSDTPKKVSQGIYVFTVTGTDTKDSTVQSTATIKVTVL